MKLPVSIAEKLVLMQNGEKIPFSKVKHSTVDLMIENGILRKQLQGHSKAWVYLPKTNRLDDYLKNHFGIDNLTDYIAGLKRSDLSRSEAIAISSDSKIKSIRTFKGFLVNSYDAVDCLFKGEAYNPRPREGTFTFMYDFEEFLPSPQTTIVGIENPENFRHIQSLRYLFPDIQALFVSRYPQSGDLIKWLQIIPNDYLHFGDFDIAGLNIYVNEFKKHLKERAKFFLPPNLETLLSEKGNRRNYDNQKICFNPQDVKEEHVAVLLRIIERYKKGLEQEFFIER